MDLTNQIQDFLKFLKLEKNFSDNTHKAYQKDLSQLQDFLKKNQVSNLDRNSLTDFLA